jgi:Holliday junction DNA helicase RuvA
VITRLTGLLLEADLTEIVVDVNGVGYAVTVPMSTYDRLPNLEQKLVLFTHMHVREDAMQLFGFASREERQLFRLLITVSGVGPRLALNVLSCMSVSAFCATVAAADTKALGKISGVGKRMAERLAVELREKVSGLDPAASLGGQAATSAGSLTQEAQDAIGALETLGFKAETARKTIQKLIQDAPSQAPKAETLIRKALQQLNS